MPPRLHVYALPEFADPNDLSKGTVVVIDVLRASTTILYALHAGAKAVIPCREIGEARSIARQYSPAEVLLGGERGGLPIDGFDLGNSPHEYTPRRVKGKIVIFTTTNGTQALLHARRARQILLGAFVNASAVIEKLLARQEIHLLCAGTDGQLSEDDILLAGMIVERLQHDGGMTYEQNAQAIAACDLWLHTFTTAKASGSKSPKPARLAKEFQKSLGGKNLVALGLEKDIIAAAQIDQFQIVPQFNPETSRIQLIE